MAVRKTEYIKFGENLYEIIPPLPSGVDRGGIIASPKESTDTVEIKLGDDGKLYAPTYPDLSSVDTSGIQTQIDELAVQLDDKADKEHTHDTYETKEDAQLKYDEFDDVKKDKDLIVTYQEGTSFNVTHSSQEILEAVNNGQTVKFKKGSELLNLLEATESYATFYMLYVNMDNKLQQQIIAVSNDSIMLEQDNEYDYAIKNHTHDEYANKTHTHTEYETTENATLKYDELSENIASKQNALTGTEGQVVQFNADGNPIASDLELITADDIHAICGGSIQYAEEVRF